MSRTISSDEPVHNVVDAEVLLGRLDEYRSELDAREESFNHVLETGESMIEEGHFAADEVMSLFVCLFVCLFVSSSLLIYLSICWFVDLFVF